MILQLSPRSFFSHLTMRSLLPEGGTDARNAAPARGGKLPGAGALLPLPPLLLLLLLSAAFNKYLHISNHTVGDPVQRSCVSQIGFRQQRGIKLADVTQCMWHLRCQVSP